MHPFLKCNKRAILSYSINDLLTNRDPSFLKHDERTAELQESSLVYCYANTVVLETPSSKYNTNHIKYKQYILLEDFYQIAKDHDIDLKSAVEFSVQSGDVHVRCNCPAFLYWGNAYMGTELKYLYGLPRENRPPVVRNPEMKGTICKHADKAMRWCMDHIPEITQLFNLYYNRLDEGNKLVAVDSTGKEVQIGNKSGEGDVFMEEPEEEKVEEGWEKPFDDMDDLEFEEEGYEETVYDNGDEEEDSEVIEGEEE